MFHGVAFHPSANPDAFAGAAARGGLRVVGVGFLLDDADDLLDGQIGLRIAGADAGDADVAHGAVEVRREDFGPPAGSVAAAVFVGLRLRPDGEQMPVGGERDD